MKIRFMKTDAVHFFKDNLEKYYTNYFTKPDNSWMKEAYNGEDPFEDFIEIPNLELADPDYYTPGELELENCKRVYSALSRFSPSIASDERLWAGLCNDTFYDYLKRRFNNYELHNSKKDNSEIKMRFFYSDKGRSGIYSNPLSKWWWIGKSTYNPYEEDHFEKLDIIGGADFSTKSWIIFNSYTFSANQVILDGIIGALKFFKDNNIKLVWKKEFRAAMKYLNAYGGGVLLDMMSSEEIQELLIRKILELLKGYSEGITYGNSDDDEPIEDGTETQGENENNHQNDNDHLSELEGLLKSEKADIIYVGYGDKVSYFRLEDGTEFEYTMPLTKSEMNNVKPDILKSILGRKKDERFIYLKNNYIITEIEKNN